MVSGRSTDYTKLGRVLAVIGSHSICPSLSTSGKDSPWDVSQVQTGFTMRNNDPEEIAVTVDGWRKVVNLKIWLTVVGKIRDGQ